MQMSFGLVFHGVHKARMRPDCHLSLDLLLA